MISNCPGSKQFKRPEPEYIKCNFCSSEIEIWTDEVQTKCPQCKNTVIRQGDGIVSCLDWCRYAKDCVGEQAFNKYKADKCVTLKQKLLKELEDYFGTDLKRINHAKKVLGYAEELLKKENADWFIVVPASILHDVGIKIAEEKYNSSAGNYQEKEGPAIARKVLLKFGFKKEDIDQICEIIAHHHSPGKITTQNFKVLYDADWLVNLKDEIGLDDKERLKSQIDKVFLTEAAKELARKVFL